MLTRVAPSHPDRDGWWRVARRLHSGGRRCHPSASVQPGRAGPVAARKVCALRGARSRFKFALAVPIQTPCNIATSPPRPSQGRLRVHPLWSPRRPALRPSPARGPGRQSRARCACRVAPWRRGSLPAPPPSLSRAPVPPDPPISKSTPSDLEFECPHAPFKIERQNVNSAHRASLARP